MVVREREPVENGTVFGRLTVLHRGEDITRGGCQRPNYICICSCGNLKGASANLLKRGEIISCGCSKAEIGARSKTHGMRDTPTYQSWAHMKKRCLNKKCKDYPDYGGRGISFDPAWRSFDNFLKDMGSCPEGLSIDRVDTNGNYTKSNCKWSDNYEQSHNRRQHKNNTSGRTGVAWHKKSMKWQVTMRHKGTLHCAGWFVNFDDAAKAREALELKHRGAVRSEAYESQQQHRSIDARY